MLVIGHRGAKGRGTVNTIEAMRYALEQGADGLEFDVRLTKDGVPIVIHDDRLLFTRGTMHSVHTSTYEELLSITTKDPIPTLTDVLDNFWGKTYLNIELKSHGSGETVATILEKNYITQESEWDNCLVSSFKIKELRSVRSHSIDARLALLHNHNPYTFLLYQRSLKFSGLGFHRLYVSLLSLAIAKRLGIFTYAYTVNRPGGAHLMHQKQIDAVITDYPRRIIDVLRG